MPHSPGVREFHDELPVLISDIKKADRTAFSSKRKINAMIGYVVKLFFRIYGERFNFCLRTASGIFCGIKDSDTAVTIMLRYSDR